MEYFDIKGGDIIKGEVTLSGNKNEALPVIAAALLSTGKVRISNVPDILDVRVMLEIAADMGASVTKITKNEFEIDASNLIEKPLNREMCGMVRTSILFAGPLLARTGSVILPPPGGDVIGRRRLDTHFIGLEQLGAECSFDNEGYVIISKQLRGADVFLDEASVTATENIVMAAVFAEGISVIRNAATEPHVQGLCNFLNKMGARIKGIGTNIIHIEGVSSLGGCSHRIGADYIEAGSFIALAAMTGGELLIKDVGDCDLRSVLNTFKKIGISTQMKGPDLFVPHHEELLITKEINNAIPKIDDGPWPSFPSDLMSIAIVASTKSKGTVLFFEKMFESRLFFVDRLIGMGAQIILCDPHRVVVSGPSELRGSKLDSPDIRAGMALLMAAISARGKSRIYNIRQIDRGYEAIEYKLRQIGVTIDRNED
ncbi:MAG TPA: UDP-N-acetylglucosamine 1-carboxyvinyltransferase [bacterium]|nr:UDP-N-acetylglucosamine 1-carboxyvinyltransferase [bacterium]HPS28857.1 UDP-N-acetylglucosamine 1-carboxyvinyltransferase [bacterium]